MTPLLQILCLILTANGSPALARHILGTCLAAPIDGGYRFMDGRPLFGATKTWAGLLVAVIVTTIVAVTMGLSLTLGVMIGIAAMAGDLLSSFTKRRFGLASSRSATGLDQLPESLFPTLVAARPLDLSLLDMGLAIALFFALEIILSRLLNRLSPRATR